MAQKYRTKTQVIIRAPSVVLPAGTEFDGEATTIRNTVIVKAVNGLPIADASTVFADYVELVTPPAPPVHNVVFAANPVQVVAGSASTLSWSGTDGANGIYLDTKDPAHGLPGPSGTLTVTPAQTTTYTLIVTYPNEPDVTRTATVTVIPAPPPQPQISMRMNGIHCMQFSGEAARLDGCMAFVSLDNNDELRRLASLGHKCWFRKWIGDAHLSPQQVIDNTPYLGEHEPWYADNPIGLILSNERDTGLGNLSYVQQAQWERAAIKYGVQTRGLRRFAVGTYPMGTPDITSAQVRADLATAYRDMLNSQTADGVPAIIDLDLHNYVPNFDKWLYPQTAHTTVTWSGGIPYQISYETRYTKAYYDDGETSRSYVSTHLSQPIVGASTLVAGGRSISPWDWYLTRYSFWFWPEYGIGLDPARVKVIASESGEDEGGVGGCKAHGRTTADVRRAMLRMLDLVSAPLVMDVSTGRTAASPFYAGCWFQMGDNVRWAGYNLADYVNNHLGADAYRRAA